MIDPVVLLTAAALIALLLTTAWLTRPNRRRSRAQHAVERHCLCGARATHQIGGQWYCTQHAWNLGAHTPRDGGRS